MQGTSALHLQHSHERSSLRIMPAILLLRSASLCSLRLIGFLRFFFFRCCCCCFFFIFSEMSGFERPEAEQLQVHRSISPRLLLSRSFSSARGELARSTVSLLHQKKFPSAEAAGCRPDRLMPAR